MTKTQQPRPRHVIKPADVRREELMDAAAKLFISNGVEKTTIDNIVIEAAASKGTFYHYFKSKNELVEALRERFSNSFREQTQAAVDAVKDDDWDGKLHAWIKTAVQAYIEDFEIHDVVYHEYGNHSRASAELNAVLEQIEAILLQGCNFGAWSIRNLRVTAIVMYQGFHGVVDDFIASRSLSAEQITEELTVLFSRLLHPSN